MPIFVQLLSIIRTNNNVIQKFILGGKCLSSKSFVYKLICELMSCACESAKDDRVNTNILSHFGESDFSTLTPNQATKSTTSSGTRTGVGSKTKEPNEFQEFDVISAITRHVQPLEETYYSRMRYHADKTFLS